MASVTGEGPPQVLWEESLPIEDLSEVDVKYLERNLQLQFMGLRRPEEAIVAHRVLYDEGNDADLLLVRRLFRRPGFAVELLVGLGHITDEEATALRRTVHEHLRQVAADHAQAVPLSSPLQEGMQEESESLGIPQAPTHPALTPFQQRYLPTRASEWQYLDWGGAASRQTSDVNTSKLAVTISSLVAAVLVAGALFRTSGTSLNIVASVLLGVSFFLAILTLLLDRRAWPDHREALERQMELAWTDDQLVLHLDHLHRDTERRNDMVVRMVTKTTLLQYIVAGASGTVAVVSLLLRGA